MEQPRFSVVANGVTTYYSTTHCARHTFATTVCLGSGIPIQVVQRMLGHSNIHTTEIYTHMTETDLIGGYDMIK